MILGGEDVDNGRREVPIECTVSLPTDYRAANLSSVLGSGSRQQPGVSPPVCTY